MSLIRFEETNGNMEIIVPQSILEKANFTSIDEYEIITTGESISIIKKNTQSTLDSDWLMSGSDHN